MNVVRLQILMDKKKLSQNKLAKISGVSQTHISRLVLGTQQPTLPTIRKLASGLGVTMAELLDEPKRKKTG